MLKNNFTFGSQSFDYYIELSNRKTLEIVVNPNLSVIVKAPLDTKEEVLQQKIKKRAYWILKQKEYFSSFLSSPTKITKYISGGSIYYLGKQYRLKIIQSKKDEVKLFRGFLFIYTKNRYDDVLINKLIDKWYLEHAKIFFYKS